LSREITTSVISRTLTGIAVKPNSNAISPSPRHYFILIPERSRQHRWQNAIFPDAGGQFRHRGPFKIAPRLAYGG